MTVTPKFNVGDSVYLIYDNKLHKEPIYKIKIELTKLSLIPSIVYIFNIFDDSDNDYNETNVARLEQEIAIIKEKLFQQLFEQFKENYSSDI
jgi:hypothetical protein